MNLSYCAPGLLYYAGVLRNLGYILNLMVSMQYSEEEASFVTASDAAYFYSLLN
jgi:hypothetical protein